VAPLVGKESGEPAVPVVDPVPVAAVADGAVVPVVDPAGAVAVPVVDPVPVPVGTEVGVGVGVA